MTKSLPFIGVLLLFLLLGCSKSHSSPQPGLTGRWRLVDAESVIPGGVVDYAAGAMMEFHTDSTYSQIAWGRVVVSGTFSTSVSNTGTASQSFLTLKDAGSSTPTRFEMRLTGLQLTLTDTYAVEYYQKL